MSNQGDFEHRARCISEVTRRGIADYIQTQNVNWSGRFGEHEFLARLYNLQDMPSTDRRFTNASEDIWQHRVRNCDWENDWVFYDSRFALLQVADDEFLKFLCEILHPVVQSDPNTVEEIRSTMNSHLSTDGWELREQMTVSGRPVFAASRIMDADYHTREAAALVSETIGGAYVSRQVTRMQSAIHSDPDLAVGQAKEFVETICKTILGQRQVSFEESIDLPKLVRLTMRSVELVPQSVSEPAATRDAVKRLLSNLATISDSAAQLRNLHGTGHGKEAESKGLSLRHARLAVGASVALAVFLLESHLQQ